MKFTTSLFSQILHMCWHQSQCGKYPDLDSINCRAAPQVLSVPLYMQPDSLSFSGFASSELVFLP